MGVLGPKKNQQLTLDNFLCHDDSNSDSDSNSIRFHPGVNFPHTIKSSADLCPCQSSKAEEKITTSFFLFTLKFKILLQCRQMA